MKHTVKTVLAKYGKYVTGDYPGVHLWEFASENEIKMAREIARLRNRVAEQEKQLKLWTLSGSFR